MAKTKDRFIGFYVPSSQAHQIEEAARREGRSLSSWLRYHTRRIIQTQEKEEAQPRTVAA